jgi:putative ABC transport system permease protein
VLTESTAKKYFGTDDPLGQWLTIFDKEHLVSGVIKDLPANSDLWFTMLASMDSTDRRDDWFDFALESTRSNFQIGNARIAS